MYEQGGPFLFFKVLGLMSLARNILHQKNFPCIEFAFLAQGGLYFHAAVQKDDVLPLRGPVKIIVIIGRNLSELKGTDFQVFRKETDFPGILQGYLQHLKMGVSLGILKDPGQLHLNNNWFTISISSCTMVCPILI